jgi:hypothetical protein
MAERGSEFTHKAFYDMYGKYVHIDKRRLVRTFGKEVVLINNNPAQGLVICEFGGATFDQALLQSDRGNTVLVFDEQTESLGKNILSALQSGDVSIATDIALGSRNKYNRLESMVEQVEQFYADLLPLAQSDTNIARIFGLKHSMHEAPSNIADISQFCFPFPHDFFDMDTNPKHDLLSHGLRVLKDNGSFVVTTEDADFYRSLKLLANSRKIKFHDTVKLLNRLHKSVSDVMNYDSPIYELVFFK